MAWTGLTFVPQMEWTVKQYLHLMHRNDKALKNTVLSRFNVFIFCGYFMRKREKGKD
jgi:hypothetical protein